MCVNKVNNVKCVFAMRHDGLATLAAAAAAAAD
jgi:hypothetical protein